MLENSLGKKLNNAKSINADSASAYQKFYLEHNLKLNAVPSGFHSDGQINIAEINVVSAIKILYLILKEVRMEILFSSAILLILKPFNKLSITLLHTSKESLLQ